MGIFYFWYIVIAHLTRTVSIYLFLSSLYLVSAGIDIYLLEWES